MNRSELLAAYERAVRDDNELGTLLLGASEYKRARIAQHREEAVQRIWELRRAYAGTLARPAISRDPFTTKIVHHEIDTEGIDGPWWDYGDPVRTFTPPPEGSFALTGALRLEGAPERTPFLVRPGPEAPYVIPRILEHVAVRAVVSTIAIGVHTGFAITYLASPVPQDLRRVDAWGAPVAWFTGADGEFTWDEVPLVRGELDFDLEPWIADGKLQWIAPGDAHLKLRATTDDCPYIGLPGRRDILRIQDGSVWTREVTV